MKHLHCTVAVAVIVLISAMPPQRSDLRIVHGITVHQEKANQTSQTTAAPTRTEGNTSSPNLVSSSVSPAPETSTTTKANTVEPKPGNHNVPFISPSTFEMVSSNTRTSTGAIQNKRHRSCSLIPGPGECQAAFPRYYYNSSTSQCDCYLFGGCDEEEGSYQTLQECQKMCLPDDPTEGPICKEVFIPNFSLFTDISTTSLPITTTPQIQHQPATSFSGTTIPQIHNRPTSSINLTPGHVTPPTSNQQPPGSQAQENFLSDQQPSRQGQPVIFPTNPLVSSGYSQLVPIQTRPNANSASSYTPRPSFHPTTHRPVPLQPVVNNTASNVGNGMRPALFPEEVFNVDVRNESGESESEE